MMRREKEKNPNEKGMLQIEVSLGEEYDKVL
jgi:hypothetical protein